MHFAFYATLTFFVVLCVLFALLILVQKGRGGGISSAFGGAGGNTAFGSKTGDVLTWATSVVFAVFLICCVALSLLANRVNAEMTGTVVAAPDTNSLVDLPPVATPTSQPTPSANPSPATAPTSQPGAIVNPTLGR